MHKLLLILALTSSANSLSSGKRPHGDSESPAKSTAKKIDAAQAIADLKEKCSSLSEDELPDHEAWIALVDLYKGLYKITYEITNPISKRILGERDLLDPERKYLRVDLLLKHQCNPNATILDDDEHPSWIENDILIKRFPPQ